MMPSIADCNEVRFDADINQSGYRCHGVVGVQACKNHMAFECRFKGNVGLSPRLGFHQQVSRQGPAEVLNRSTDAKESPTLLPDINPIGLLEEIFNGIFDGLIVLCRTDHFMKDRIKRRRLAASGRTRGKSGFLGVFLPGSEVS